MAEFLIEAYAATVAGDDAAAIGRRARAAAAWSSAAGRPARCLQSILVIEEETCFLVLEARTADDARAVAERAQLPVVRISDAAIDRAHKCRPAGGKVT